MELEDNSYHEGAKLAKAIRKVRRERRRAKDKATQLQPIMDWLSDNSKTVNDLERLLGAVRKAEKGTENRIYLSKTDVVKNTIGE